MILTSLPQIKDIPVDDLFESQDYTGFISRMEYFKTVRGFAVVCPASACFLLALSPQTPETERLWPPPLSRKYTHDSILIFQGVDVKAISRRLGQENITITLRAYGHLLPNQDKRAAAMMDEFAASLDAVVRQ